MRIFATLALLAVTLAACESTTSPESEQNTASMASPVGAWQLQAIELSSGEALVAAPGQYTLELFEDGTSHARVDCNLCNGTYVVDGSTITFGLQACTLAACPPESLFDDVVRAMNGSATFTRDGNSLSIAYAQGVLRYVGM